MTMDRADFGKFFKAANKDRKPFRWQERLLDAVLGDGQWPGRIVAPTGSGKTSAIDVHVFAVAYASVSGGPRLPRRLAMVVDRRVLVDDQYQRARELADLLDSGEPQSDIVAEVAEILRALANPAGVMKPTAPPLVTARLRGGSVPSRSWRDRPTACTVLCATPDMWGSRLLFNGYATSGLAASREAGLLAYDSVVLADEAHLARQLLATARRVAHLATVAEQPIARIPALQVVEVTATPAGPAEPGQGQRTVAVTKEDLKDDEFLKDRLTRPKPVTTLGVSGWPGGRQPGKAAKAIADAVATMHADVTAAPAASVREASGESRKLASTIGCYVNSVPMALAVSAALRSPAAGGKPLNVVTVCGQVRPADIERLRGFYENILTTRGNAEVDVIVSTQSLEVGADLDLAGIVTELASGAALAQRAGRVNRLGIRAEGRVTVVMPDGPVTGKMDSGPYDHDELKDAQDWVSSMRGDGLSPWLVRVNPPPPARDRRTLYQRPELGDAWHWARTSDSLAAEPELDLWLSDSFDDESSVGIVVRDALPASTADALAFVHDLPPVKWEPFPVPYKTARAVLKELIEDDQVMVRVRGEDASILEARPNGNPDIRPGDQVIVDSSAKITTKAPGQRFSPAVVVAPASAEEGDRVDPALRASADDVLHHQQPGLRDGTVVLRIEWSPAHEKITEIPQATARRIIAEFTQDVIDGEDKRPGSERRARLLEILERVPDDEYPPEMRDLTLAVKKLLGTKVVKNSDLILRQRDDGGARLVLLDNRKPVADEDLRQVFTPRGSGCVLLQSHQADVAERARQLSSSLQLPAGLLKALVAAGLHHDDGKADRRFQEHRLGSGDPARLLAKSSRADPSRRQVQQDQAQGGLPSNWRHEQRSVVDSWATVQADPDVDHDLVRRLIGTSHGRGRSGFPHTEAELADREEADEWKELAVALFDEGGWDELIEATQLRYGVWGCAYLEAVLRAADCQISGEGK
jgi:CRISPR-associated endonuclease/helicase Cas3